MPVFIERLPVKDLVIRVLKTLTQIGSLIKYFDVQKLHIAIQPWWLGGRAFCLIRSVTLLQWIESGLSTVYQLFRSGNTLSIFFLLLDKPRSYITVDLIFLRLQCCKSLILGDSTDNCITVPTITL